MSMRKEINGVQIAYTLDGTGENRVLLLHGWGCEGKTMQPVANALKERFQVLIPDFPGHGGADARRNPGVCRSMPDACGSCWKKPDSCPAMLSRTVSGAG